MTIGLIHLPPQRKTSVVSSGDRRGLGLLFYRCFQNYYHGHRFLNPEPHYIPHVRLSINHWQIRDLVQIDAGTGSVFHTSDEHIRVLSMKNRTLQGPIRLRTHVSLPYRPRCFHHAPGGLVVAGGVTTSLSKAYLMSLPDLALDFPGAGARKLGKGLFSIYSPGMAEGQTFQLGDMINNAVAIYPQQNSTASYTSYVCNNDSNLYIVDISDAGIRGDRNIVCEPNVSLNNVHQSQDGRLVTVTGDTGAIFLVDPLQQQPVVKRIETTHDAGFGISYHNNGVTFAAAFQDGTCSMFDLRNTSQPLHEIRSTRAGQQPGAFRTCRFLQLPIQDLLVVLEHLGRVHLVDLRELSEDNHQVIVFPYALDQYARYRSRRTKMEDDFDTDMHPSVKVYHDDAAHFTAPLVYDRDYVAEVSPKLFKGFTYEPPHGILPEVNRDQSPDHVTNQHCILDGLVDVNMESAGASMSSGVSGSSASSNQESHRDYAHVSREQYQQSVNHVNGEMEIAGLDWYDNQLYIGCEDGGLLVWDVNLRARRSCGSFSYV